MLSIYRRENPLKVLAMAVLWFGVFIAITFAALHLAIMAWGAYGFYAFEVVLVAYCIVLLWVIIRL